MDVDILTLRSEWNEALPLEGEIRAEGPDACVDGRNGVSIDLLFAEDERGMSLRLPDPRDVLELDEELGANFIGLHALVQFKMSVYLSKLEEDGLSVAAKDLGDVTELIWNNLDSFSPEVFEKYEASVRSDCLKVFTEVTESLRRKKAGGGKRVRPSQRAPGHRGSPGRGSACRP